MTTTSKAISLDSVLTGITGRLCGNFADFHEAVDVMFPGITNVGLAYMSKEIAEEMRMQFPVIAMWVNENHCDWNNKEAFLAWRDRANATFPMLFTIRGPVAVEESVIAENCKKFFDGVDESREKSGRGPLEFMAVRVG
jgi:hypothetical protein